MKKEPYRDFATECFRQYGLSIAEPQRARGAVERENVIAAARAIDALSPEARDAVYAVYIFGGEDVTRRGEIQRRVTEHALRTFQCEDKVYRMLRIARDLCATERGMKEKS